MSRRTGLLALCLLGAVGLPGEARALRCSEWERLSYEAKRDVLYRMTEDALRGARTQKYRVNRMQVARCIQDQADAIIDQFDYTCALGQRASLNALDRQFKDWAWSCIP